ncbi:MAG: GNAT family N-acetyltransferase, partial [Clostridiales bacterium]|nr:GNAT family N-acetyltransferase [Clostridiales bacterium]
EASKEVIRYGFEDLKLEVISVHTSETNKRSQGVIKKCRFKYEGLLRNTYRIYTGEKRNSLVFSLLKEEWGK